MHGKRILDGVVWNEDVVATLDHVTGKIVHVRLSLGMEVLKHLIGGPAPNEADGVMVNMCTRKGHSTGCTKRAGTNVQGGDAKGGSKVAEGKTEGLCDVVASDRFGGAVGSIISTKGGVRRSIVTGKVSDALNCGGHRTTPATTTAAKTNGLLAVGVFLGVIGEGDKGCCRKYRFKGMVVAL
jgi:hypothetical protein